MAQAKFSSTDKELLITLVSQHPVLYDKTLHIYLNRMLSLKAWTEISVHFEGYGEFVYDCGQLLSLASRIGVGR